MALIPPPISQRQYQCKVVLEEQSVQQIERKISKHFRKCLIANTNNQ
jgi:hypothetical protein